MKDKSDKIVIFDWGGVIESHKVGEYNVDVALISLFKRFNKNLSDKESLEIYNSAKKNEEGKIISEIKDLNEIQKWFKKIKKLGSFDCTFKEFCEAYEEELMKIYFYKDVVDFAHSLKNKCKIGILSNLNYLDKNRINMQVNLNQFDYTWLSFELECRKPDETIYAIVENDCDISPNNILFIDDKLENILAAKKRNWDVCQAYGYELNKIKNEVLKFINK